MEQAAKGKDREQGKDKDKDKDDKDKDKDEQDTTARTAAKSLAPQPVSIVSPLQLARYDIVLTTYRVLGQEVNHADLAALRAQRARRGRSRGHSFSSSSSSSSSRVATQLHRGFTAVPSPLLGLRFWRVLLDEAQEVESGSSKHAAMALRIAARHRHCVTGTPLREDRGGGMGGRGRKRGWSGGSGGGGGGGARLGDLRGLLLFLGAPFSSRRLFDRAVLGLVGGGGGASLVTRGLGGVGEVGGVGGVGGVEGLGGVGGRRGVGGAEGTGKAPAAAPAAAPATAAPATTGETRAAAQRLRLLLCSLMWRNCKGNPAVARQLRVPPREERKHALRFTDVEVG